MARLRFEQEKRTWVLAPTNFLGRSGACDLRLDGKEVSAHHALICWNRGVWEIQDLHSRNGTFVDGARLGTGARAGLHEGVEIGFGRPMGYQLVDTKAPQAQARSVDEPALVVEARSELLALPDELRVELSVTRRADRWWAEEIEEVWEVHDGDLVNAGGSTWQLRLPESTPETEPCEPGKARQLRLDSLELHFGVSDNEHRVDVVVRVGTERIDLGSRAHHQPLLLLAKARLDDLALPAAEQGWVHQNELIERLGLTSNRLYVDIHRLRRQFGEAGVVGATKIVERRPGTKQLRIGVSHVRISENPRRRTFAGPKTRAPSQTQS
ncbi:MAG: FHA domain-containing protein [Nannocystaceae bacterium]